MNHDFLFSVFKLIQIQSKFSYIWCYGNYEIGEYKNGSLYSGAIYNKNGVALSVYNNGELINKDFNGDLALYSGTDISSDISSNTEVNSN